VKKRRSFQSGIAITASGIEWREKESILEREYQKRGLVWGWRRDLLTSKHLGNRGVRAGLRIEGIIGNLHRIRNGYLSLDHMLRRGDHRRERVGRKNVRRTLIFLGDWLTEK